MATPPRPLSDDRDRKIFEAIKRPTPTRQAAIAALNDVFRCSLGGLVHEDIGIHDDCPGPRARGQFVITRGVAALGHATLARVLAAVTRFDAWTRGNDPYGEHDFGGFEVEGTRFYFKIDYYASAELTLGAEDPLESWRVLTVMLAEEY